MTNESGLTSTVTTTKCQYFFVNPVRLNYFLIAHPPSLDDVRSLRPRFIPIQRRMKQHLMTLNWNGAEPRPAVELRRTISRVLLRYHIEEVLRLAYEVLCKPEPGGDSQGHVVTFQKTRACSGGGC